MIDDPKDDEMSDEDVLAMLGDDDDGEADAKDDAGSDSGSDASADDEAAALLAEAEGDSPDDEAEALLAEAEGDSGGDDMADDEAAALLAEMEGGEPEEPEAEAPKAEAPADDMGDDEAAALLAEMEGGGDPEPKAEAPKEDMADDEAARLLAEMEGGGDSGGGDDDGDDAEALLAKLGGDDEETAPEAPAEAAAEDSGDGDEESAGEIDEWEANDFQTDPTMMDDFLTNTDELMDTLDDTILKLEQNPEDKEIIEEIFRAAHTLKGAAGMFGFRALERVMHRMENMFDLVRKGKLVPNSDSIDIVFEGLDIIKKLLEAVKDGKPCGIKTAPIVDALTLAAAGKAPKKSGAAAAAPAAPAPSSGGGGGGGDKASDGGGGGGGDAPKKAAKKKETSTIRVDLQRLDALVNLVGELVIDRTRFISVENDLRNSHPQLPATGNLAETVQLYGRHMNDIQNIIMKIRMVPIGNAFNKYPRIVRDLARSLGKQIDLIISGETAELDKTLVEQIGDPLVHLIRNACDHGVEDPETRQAAGKTPGGMITLSAHQEGNQIIIMIEDDGKGIDADVIRKKAIEKGLISEEDQLSQREIYGLIFAAGFSTAEKVTNVSGRGVGMDVVKKQISKLKGSLEVDSELGRGTRIEIRLPLTLAIVQSLLVKVDNEMYAIPLDSVIESIRVRKTEIQKVGDSEVINLRNRVLPLMYLTDTLNLAERAGGLADMLSTLQSNGEDEKFREKRRERTKESVYIVIVGSGERRFGIVVDQLLNQQEMVIKSLGPLLKNIPCVAGGAVLGQGEVVLVLDIADLEDSFRVKNRSSQVDAA